MVASLVDLASPPRVALIPDGDDHPKWGEVVEFVNALGVELDDWQWLVLRTSLRRRDDLWAAFTVGVCAPRQNGKNSILEVRELVGPLVLGEKLLIHTAHLADTSMEAFRRLDDLIDANEWLSRQVKHIWRANGKETIEFRGGRRVRFRTRTRGGGRGFSGSPVFFDESMFLPEVSLGSILPVISAQPDPQIWLTGSAVDQQIMDDGMSFARVRQQALRGSDDRLAYFEWSLDAETPEAVDDEVAGDESSWQATNPAFGIRITGKYVKAERNALDPRTFAVERLGVGDWPDPDLAGASVIDRDEWNALTDGSSKMEDPVAFAFDVSPDRSSSAISAAGRRADGLAHVEVIEHKSGTNWVLSRIVELMERWDPVAVVCDASGPAGSLLRKFEELEIEVQAVSAREHSQACGLLYDMVKDAGLRHLGTQELRAAIRGASTRPLGEAWAWSRKSSAIDITPLVACTLALYGIQGALEQEPPVMVAFG